MRRFRVFAFVGVLGVLGRASAGAQGPSADWRTLETEHFRVHFPAPLEAWARHAAGALEPLHGRVTAFVGHVPERRIEVVVSDPAADANGVAVPFLDRPEILLFTSPPGPGSGLDDFPDWMEMLATHELAHVAQLARPAAGSLAILARLSPAPFGPLALAAPRWVTEGYATLVEGVLTGSGRPTSTLRATFLRTLAAAGKLPDYDQLDGGNGWLSGAVPYLAGSAFLEWLSARTGESSLPRLWERMASSAFPGRFDASFRDVFGDSPENLYGRFVAETAEQAAAEERRLAESGAVAGELTASLKGGTLSPQVSPDGTRLLARRDPSRRESLLAVWDLSASGASGPVQTLPRIDGYSPSDPRWMPDGRRVLFSRRAPDADGTLRRDLYSWDTGGGAIARVTRRADVFEADPSPDGAFAVAVRGRHGATELVRVALATGEVQALPVETESSDAWPVWAEPRLSPDGARIAALLHRDGQWRLVVLDAAGGPARELAAGVAGVAAPAWSPDGRTIYVTAQESGYWNVAEIPAGGDAPLRLRTRAAGGGFAPAPDPGGRSLYFLTWTARGIDVRRIDLAGPEDLASLAPAAGSPARASAPSSSAPAAPYSVWPSQAVRPLLNFAIGPDGDTVQVGVDGSDVLGRFHWLAAGSFGNTPGPRGATAAAAWRGLPFRVSVQAFGALEKPGRQSLAPRPELDVERIGAYFEAAWTRPFSWGRLEVAGGTGAASYEPQTPPRVEDFFRALGNARGRVVYRRTRGRWGAGLDVEVEGAVGETRGLGWTQAAGSGRLLGITPIGTFAAGARGGETGGRPSRFDVFAIGGSPSTILPPGFDRNRIENPALPSAVQLGRKFEAYRAELETASLPLVVYGEWLRAWNGGEARPDFVQAAGAEARLERLIPAEFGRTVSFRVGAAWIASTTPSFHTVRGYADLIYRP